MKKANFQDLVSAKDVWNKMQYILSHKQKRQAILLLLMTIFGALLETLGVSIVVPLVQAFLAADELLRNSYIAPVATFFRIQTGNQLIIIMSAFVVLIYIFKNLYLIFLSYIRIKYASKVRRELSVRIMNSYMKRGYAFFLGVNTSDLLRGAGYDVNGVYEVLYQTFRILSECLTALCLCIYIIYNDASMAAGLIFLLGISLGTLLVVFRKKMKGLGDAYRKCTVKTDKCLHEAYQGVKDVLVFGREHYFSKTYEKLYSNQQKVEIVKTVASESPAYFIEAVCVSGFIIVVCMKILFGTDSAAFLPKLITFAVAAFRILPSIGRISGSFNLLVYACPAMNATYRNLKEVESNEKLQTMENVGKQEVGELSFKNKIEIRNLSWHYPASDKLVLNNLNLKIDKGTSVAFIGQSGAGKSTLADILLGLLIPQSGNIMIDNKDISKNMNAWKKMIGYVPQTVFLRDDTVRNNIAFGLDEEEIDDDKIARALEQAQLTEVINELPEGVHTLMGERGIRFSGGQKQRVAIARALYNDPDILIMDEATAALDNDTEKAVMEAIDALHGKKTLIIVAHRLTTIRNCDKIYEIGQGIATLKSKEEIFGE